MLKEIFHYIYCMSIPSTIFVLISVCCFWNYLSAKCISTRHKKIWNALNFLLFLLWLASIIYMTIFSRNSKTEMNLIPFHFIMDAIKTGNEEFFRTGWMNILLFIPGGMCLSYSMKKPTKIKYVLQVIFLILVSITIEIVQWYYQLGVVETDDVICNTLGGIMGIISELWTFKIVEIIKLRCNKIQNLINRKKN